LSARIEAIIRKEIAAAQASAKSRSSKSTTASTSSKSTAKAEKSSTPYVLANTPDAIKLSNDFEGNKGRLPWPVEQGVITGSFGRHAHPVWHDVVVNNNGVNIATNKGAKARAVFDGKVVRVLMVVDKYAVLVQHGEYFTLYSNLESVSVQSGDRVSTRQVLGTIMEGDQEGKGEVHLEIWRGSTKMNPQSWLASR
jgi:murein hydrolase activator